MAIDIQASTARNNLEKARVRRFMYDLLNDGMRASGLAGHHDPLVDRGNGVLVLFRPADRAPKTLLPSTLLPNLGKELAAQLSNAGSPVPAAGCGACR